MGNEVQENMISASIVIYRTWVNLNYYKANIILIQYKDNITTISVGNYLKI